MPRDFDVSLLPKSGQQNSDLVQLYYSIPEDGCVDVLPLDPKDSIKYEWLGRIRYAWQRFKVKWPEAAYRFSRCMKTYYAFQSKDNIYEAHWGCTCGHDWNAQPWTCHVSLDTGYGLIEGWVHEMAHNVMHYMGIHLLDWGPELILNGKDELFASPARRDVKRPMGAVLQGTYSYIHVCEFELRCAETGDTEVRSQLEFNLGRMQQALEVIPTNLKATDAGWSLWIACEDWIEDILNRACRIGIEPKGCPSYV